MKKEQKQYLIKLISLINSENLIFKGGMIKVLKNQYDRFSTDIDFSISDIHFYRDAKNKLIEILKENNYKFYKKEDSKIIKIFLLDSKNYFEQEIRLEFSKLPYNSNYPKNSKLTNFIKIKIEKSLTINYQNLYMDLIDKIMIIFTYMDEKYIDDRVLRSILDIPIIFSLNKNWDFKLLKEHFDEQLKERNFAVNEWIKKFNYLKQYNVYGNNKILNEASIKYKQKITLSKFKKTIIKTMEIINKIVN